MSKFICGADFHIRSNRPQFRKDDYFKTVIKKFKQIINISNKYKAPIIVAGDFFDSIKVGHKTVNSILEELKELKTKCYVCSGQHDMSYHTHDLSSSPLQTLIHANKLILLNKSPTIISNEYFYGCSFGEKVPEPTHDDAILVIHKSITPKEPPFFLTDAISAKDAFKKYNYKIIISGDYHVPFIKKYKDRLIINCGPMLRQSIDQTELKPRIYLLDTKKVIVKPLFLDIEPAESVFAFEDIKKKEESQFTKGLEDLINTLKNKEEKPDYKQTVDLVMDKGKIRDATRNKVNSIFGEVTDE